MGALTIFVEQLDGNLVLCVSYSGKAICKMLSWNLLGIFLVILALGQVFSVPMVYKKTDREVYEAGAVFVA